MIKDGNMFIFVGDDDGDGFGQLAVLSQGVSVCDDPKVVSGTSRATRRNADRDLTAGGDLEVIFVSSGEKVGDRDILDTAAFFISVAGKRVQDEETRRCSSVDTANQRRVEELYSCCRKKMCSSFKLEFMYIGVTKPCHFC